VLSGARKAHGDVHLAALAEVRTDNQLFLPAPIRKRLGLKSGSRVRLSLADGGVLVAPIEKPAVREGA
jgi:AbrB family looped-hinge helix DNA binding protein